MKLLWQRLDGRDAHETGRALLAQLVDPMPEIALTERGKPYFVTGDLHFSISHTKECDRPVKESLPKKALSPSEYARWENSHDRAAAFLRLWVLKESYAKLTGRGLGDYLYETDFDPEDQRVTVIDGCFVAVMEAK